MSINISQAEIDTRIFEFITSIMPMGEELIDNGSTIVYPGWRPGIKIVKSHPPSERHGAQIVEYMAGPIKIARSFQPIYSDLALPYTLPRSRSQTRSLLAKHIQITVSMWHDELDDFDGETYGWLGFTESAFSLSEMTRVIDSHFEEDADFMARRKKLFDALLIAALTV